MIRLLATVGVALTLLTGWSGSEAAALTVGSKKFTESVILGDMAQQMLARGGLEVKHRHELGGTRVLWDALLKGDIDVYPEYTGTLRKEIFAGTAISGEAQLREMLKRRGLGMTRSLGFNNTYILGMAWDRARQLGIRTISDLNRYPQLRFGFSNEFMDREDGWPGLKQYYHLVQKNVRGLDHDLAYRGLAARRLDVIDLYATDAEIRYYDIRPLVDDKHYFPDYDAVYVYRLDAEQRHPHAFARLRKLEGRISEDTMTGLNAAVKLRHQPESRVAAGFIAKEFGSAAGAPAPPAVSRLDRLKRNTVDHLILVGISLSAAILIAVPLGVLAASRRRLGQALLGLAGVIQTIPALALLVFMIPLFGIGAVPAIAALFLYSLLPIIRNTYSGLHDIPVPLQESAVALGLPAGARLRLVELPLALRSILAGIKTSAVINIGTATLGALIGAGGYGQPVLTGIRLDDVGLIMEGAIPAAVLALLVQGLFELLERLTISRGLRYRKIE
ncbi:MAG: glycine betaine ABC transporter substrate-binding protein [Gammaproteobacteria bacterium]